MEPNDAKGAVEALQRAWEEFKTTNDQRLAAIEKRGVVDPLLEQKLATLNQVLNTHQTQITEHLAAVESKVNRLALAGNSDASASLTPEQREHKQAFSAYLRKGREEGLAELQRKAMSVGNDPDGGYVVVPDLTGRIVTRTYETSPIRQIAAVQPIGTDALEGLVDLGEVTAGWVAEIGTRAVGATPQVAKWRIQVHEAYAQPSATQQFLDDSTVDIDAFFGRKVGDKFGRVEATGFVAGSGAGQPRGFTSYTTAATADASRADKVLEHVATGTSGGWGTAPNGSDKLIDLVSKLNPVYLPNARWVLSRGTAAGARQLKANSQYIWLPSMTATTPESLLGYPITYGEDMPVIAANSLSVAFGDFRAGYQIVDRQGIRLLRDPFTAKPYVLFYFTYRVGGDVIDFNAIKFLKFST